MTWWFQKKRQTRYLLEQAFVATISNDLTRLMVKFMPSISARSFNALPPELQRYFIKVGK
jgi:RNase P subunit RPR2